MPLGISGDPSRNNSKTGGCNKIKKIQLTLHKTCLDCFANFHWEIITTKPNHADLEKNHFVL